jgi:hypothetical protein
MDSTHFISNYHIRGHAVALAASRRLATAVARVRSRIKSRGIYGGQSDPGTGFFRVLRFLLPLMPSTIFSTIITFYHTGLVHNRPINSRSNSGLGSTPAPYIPLPLELERTIPIERQPFVDEI